MLKTLPDYLVKVHYRPPVTVHDTPLILLNCIITLFYLKAKR